MKNAITPSADDEGDDRRDSGLAEREDARLVPALEELVEAAAEHGRDREQERVARRGGALVAEEQSGRDRAARARDAGDERERLREAVDDAVADR